MPELYRPVQGVPEGFLSALGIKNNGQNPEYLSDTVLPQVDLREWYLMRDHQWLVSNTLAALAAGGEQPLPWIGGFTDFIDNLDMAVPEGEIWYVWAVYGRLELYVGDGLAGNLCVCAANRHPTIGQAILAQTNYNDNPAGTVGSAAMVGGEVRRWFRAGTLFGMAASWARNVQAQPMFANLTLEVTRLKV